MVQSVSRKRPWLAALLAALVTGLGHLYLRRWLRAFGWLAGSFAVTFLFVDPTAFDELAAGTGGLEELLAVAPLLVVVVLSVVDAYLLARRANAAVEAADSSGASAGEATSCPHCGRELDPELAFCHWCTKSIETAEGNRSDPPNES